MAEIEYAKELTIAMCKRWEGVYLSPYLCPAGVPTIFIGATYYEDGRRVTLSDPSGTVWQAEVLLNSQLTKIYLPQVLRLCPMIDTPERLAAILDFTYNLGASNLRHSGLRRRINARQWEYVPDELRKWVKGGGNRLRGLVLRRENEIQFI